MSREHAPPAGRRRARALLAFALSLAVSFALAELWARARFGAPLPERLPLLEVRANRTRGWEMLPGTVHYTYQHPVRVNSLGLRGAEIPEKKVGERHVLALGDSLVYGQGVAEEETLPVHMEAALAKRRPGEVWRVANGGLRAYATHQELALLAELGARIRPDAVVLFWFPNDLGERDVVDTCARLEASGPIHFDVGERLEGSVLWKWRMRQVVRSSALVMEAHDLWRARSEVPPSRDFVENGMVRLAEHLERFAQMAAEGGYQPLVAAVPDPNALLGPHVSIELTRRMLELAAARGLPAIDLRPSVVAIAAGGERLPLVPYDGHYEGPANRAMAEAVVGQLLELLDAR